MTEQTIKATNKTIKQIVEQEVHRLGNNADLNHIDVSEVTDMSNLFDFIDQELEFDEDLQKWDISQWDVSNVVNMEGMFANSLFNGDISNWDVSNVRDMKFMFLNSMFEGDISGWDISPLSDKQYMFSESSLEEKYGTDADSFGTAEKKTLHNDVEAEKEPTFTKDTDYLGFDFELLYFNPKDAEHFSWKNHTNERMELSFSVEIIDKSPGGTRACLYIQENI